MKKKLSVLAIRIIVFLNFPQFICGQYTKVEQVMLFGSRINTPVVMDVQKSADKLSFTAINKSYFTYDLTLKFTDFQNMSPRIYEHKSILQPGVNKLFVLDIIDKAQQIRFRYSLNYSMAISKNPDLYYPYLIPIGDGKKVILDTIKKDDAIKIFSNYFKLGPVIMDTIRKDNANQILKTHFKLGTKDTVFSIRKGTVTALPDNNVNVERIIKSSSLEILHKDGTIAIYIGLDPSQCFLELGQTVYPGQAVGIIGDEKILMLSLLAVQEGSSLRNLEIHFSDQNGKNISAKSIKGIIVLYPKSIIIKEMTSREIKRYEKGDLF